MRQPVLQHLLHQRDQRRADHRAPHAAGAADDRHEQVFDALVAAERRRIHEALQVRVQPAGNAREQRRVDEDDDLEPRAVDAEGLGHLELPAQRADRAARPRIEQIGGRPQRGERDAPDQEVVVALVLAARTRTDERRDAGEPGVAAQKFEVAEQEVKAHAPGDRRQRQIVASHPQRDEAEAQRERKRERRARSQDSTHGDQPKRVARIAVV